MERVKGIEPSFQAWEAHVLPLNHTRIRLTARLPTKSSQNTQPSNYMPLDPFAMTKRTEADLASAMAEHLRAARPAS